VDAGPAAEGAQAVYHKIREDLEEKGVVFLDTDTALKEHPDLFKEYFASVIPVGDNKFAALNTAVWSGGSFIYVPKGVHVDIPLQAYFRINTENMGQFERTLIIVDDGASVHYVEGCTAPVYSSDSLHSAVVEIILKKDAHCRYTTIQNWSNNVYNRWRRPAPGRRRQGGALRAEHLLPDHLQVRGQSRRPHVLPGPRSGTGGRGTLQVHRQVRRSAGGRAQPVTRPASPRSPRTSCSTS
jgi:hypothetical protein